MKRILLTSTGFENKNIEKKFLELLDKEVEKAKVLFIITAANDPESIRILSKCLDDLTNCGILEENISIYDMHKLISEEELRLYDAIYVCGGSTKHLAERIEEIGFKDLVYRYVSSGGIYIGVSAGSVAVSGKYKNGILFIENKLDVHCKRGSKDGVVTTNEELFLTDEQAVFINDDEILIFE